MSVTAVLPLQCGAVQWRVLTLCVFGHVSQLGILSVFKICSIEAPSNKDAPNDKLQ